MSFGGIREIPPDFTHFTAVEIGSVTSCAQEFCGGGTTPFLGLGFDSLVRRAGIFGNHRPISESWRAALSRSISPITKFTSASGYVFVDDPLIWPGVDGVSMKSSGSSCSVEFGDFSIVYRDDENPVWRGSVSVGCPGSSIGAVNVSMSSTPWGGDAWMFGAEETISPGTIVIPTDLPPPVNVGSPTMVGANSTAILTVALADPGADAFWEISEIKAVGVAISKDPFIQPGSAAGCSTDVQSVFLRTPFVNYEFGMGYLQVVNTLLDGGPEQIAMCIDVTLGPVSPIANAPWPSFGTKSAAARFSVDGVTKVTTAFDGSRSVFLATAPMWEDGSPLSGCPVAPCSTQTALFPYLEAQGEIKQSTVSDWVAMLTTALPQNTTVRLVESSAPPPVPLGSQPALLDAIGGGSMQHPSIAPEMSLFTMALIVLVASGGVVIWEASGLWRKSKSTTRRRAVFKGKATAAALLATAPSVRAACDGALERACGACAGTLGVSTCMCRCGWTEGEAILYAMVALPAIAMVMLYI